MKLFVVTDIHSNPDKVYAYLDENPVDEIIVTGDVTDFGPEELFVDTLNRLSDYASVHALFGNCDPENSSQLLDESRAVSVHDNVSNIDEIRVVGFGGSNETPFDTTNEFDEELLYEELIKYGDVLSSDSFTILVTHTPPYQTDADKIEAGMHVGSKGVRRVVEETQPTLNLCGHVHEAIACDRLGDTVIVNPGDASSGHACLITITPEDIENKTISEINLLEL